MTEMSQNIGTPIM